MGSGERDGGQVSSWLSRHRSNCVQNQSVTVYWANTLRSQVETPNGCDPQWMTVAHQAANRTDERRCDPLFPAGAAIAALLLPAEILPVSKEASSA